MTLHVVFVDPPRPGLVLPDLVTTSGLTADEAAGLYGAMVKDTIAAVNDSGGELLVNYRPNDLLPAPFQTDTDVESEVRSLASQALDDPSEARFEVQVGSSYAARVGNTVTHLLRDEQESSVAVLSGQAPTIARTVLDSAAMKLRRSNLVIGPASRGRVSYVGFTDPIEFTGAFDPPALETLVDRAVHEGHRVDFVPMHPLVESVTDLISTVSLLRALHRADRIIPPFTMDFIDRLGLRVTQETSSPELVREST